MLKVEDDEFLWVSGEEFWEFFERFGDVDAINTMDEVELVVVLVASRAEIKISKKEEELID